MLRRRAAALFVMLTTFHFSVVVGDLACADHGIAPAAAVHDMPMDTGTARDAHVPSAELGEPPCEQPSQPHCCEAVAGCSVSGAVSAPERLTPVVRLIAQSIEEPASRTLTSFAPVPEPAPPKA